MRRHWVFVLAFCSTVATAAPPVPDAGLQAEMQGRWAEAVKIYEQALAADPAQAGLWERIADIRATRLRDLPGSVQALREAVKRAPDDARLHAKLSQAHAASKQAPEALAAISRAVELEPANAGYLRARGELAVWAGDRAAALDSYQRLYAMNPGDPEVRLGMARLNRWNGDLDDSAHDYRAYLAQKPDAEAPLMEYIEVLAERGDYARALERLEDYRARFGESGAWRKQKARMLAWAARPTPALALIDELEPAMPKDYDLSHARTVALHHARRPREALASLDETARLRPDSKESADLARFIRTPLRSYATAGAGFSTDSDDVSMRRAGVRGEYALSPETRLFGGADRQWLDADAGSGFERPDGATTLGYNRTWLGIRHRHAPDLAFDVQAGSGSARGDEQTLYELGADLAPSDTLALRLSRRQDLHAVSPRAAALGIERRANTLDATWAPDLRYTVAGRLAHDSFSDGNTRWEAQLAPRRAFLRTQRVNLDLGVAGRWFGYDEDPGNGYYAPSRYQRYAVTAFSYWKISDDDGVSLVFSGGPYKDDSMDGYRAGGDVSLEGYFGLYRDWLVDVKAAYSEYGGGDTGAYRSRLFELNLTRRF